MGSGFGCLFPDQRRNGGRHLDVPGRLFRDVLRYAIIRRSGFDRAYLGSALASYAQAYMHALTYTRRWPVPLGQ